MNQKTLTLLGIAAAVSIVIAVAVGAWKPTPDFDNSGIRDLVQDLNPSAVHAIEIEADGESARLVRQGSGFVVASKLNYPASIEQIDRVIGECMKIRTDARVTDDPADHEALKVREVDEGVQHVRFLDADGKLIVGLLVHDEPASDLGRGFFVRLEGEDAVYHTTDYVSFQAGSLDYVDKDILDLPREDIARVLAQNSGGEYTILSPEKGKVELQDIPAGKQVKGNGHESVFGAATRLSFTDFQPAADVKDLTFDSVYEVETRSQAEYRFEIATQTEPAATEGGEPTSKYFVRVSAKYVGPRQVKMEKDADDAEKKRLEGLMLAQDAVDAFNLQHQSWVYELPGYKAKVMVKPLEELLEDEKPPEDAAAPEGDEPPSDK
ncbi:MAG: DUF4340 domain-containing protein [Planctomycetes bacterium]|nr:DUF4340 domain-containing protein [Planctomycetota bacterium]